jgi:hypothetical protein
MAGQTLQLLAMAVMARPILVGVEAEPQGLTLVDQAARAGLELSSLDGILIFVRQRLQRVPQQ